VRFSTVALGVADPADAERFCVEGLGLSVDARPLPDLVYLASGPTRIALYPARELAEYAGTALRPAGGVLLALNLDSSTEVDARFERALARGATPLRRPQRTDWGGYVATLADPDGHVWELVWSERDQSAANS
jgi:catechol 2,3-dioxygenase-like lactoylglutathione lyase family enzyme